MTPDLIPSRQAAGISIPTIDQRFDPRFNSLNAIRLFLAVLVIVSHSWSLGGYGKEPGLGSQHLGDWAVAGFFAISGFLITASRTRSRTLRDYLWRRVLRIFPAFLVVLVFVGYVIAPLSSILLGAGPWTPASALQYVASDVGLWISRYGIEGMLTGIPFPGSWNGSLWTLAFEFGCYLILGALVSVVPRSRLHISVLPVFAVTATGSALMLGGVVAEPWIIEYFFVLFGYFLAGAVLFLFRENIPLTVPLAVAAALFTAACAMSNTFALTAGLPLAYLLIALGTFLPLQQVGKRNDVSYGMYIYAFPIQQVLALTFVIRVLPVWAFATIAIACTLPLAWASWLVIERPAMRLKRLSARSPVDEEGRVVDCHAA